MTANSTSEIPRLEMLGVSKRFGATLALENVSISAQPNQVLALVGENGAGKSTLMKILAGAISPDSGSMSLDGASYAPRNPLDARRSGVAMIYQELSLAPHLTVEENIVLGMEPSFAGFLNRRQIRRCATEALKELDHPEINPTAPVSRLSIANRQITEIARAIAIGCRVLILDEPTSSLTRSDTEHLFALIGRLKSKGHAIIYISHFLEEVKRVADKITVLRDGKTVHTGGVAELSPPQIVAHMVGRQLQNLYPRSSRSPGKPVLDISHLTGRSKPQNASLTLRQGEVLGIAGLVGAGRTELLRAIFALDPIRAGSVKIATNLSTTFERSLFTSPRSRWLQHVGLVSEDRKTEGLALSLPISDNLTLSRLPFFLTPAAQSHQCDPWVNKLSIKCRTPRQPVGDLSGGNQQKVAIARLLHHDAQILLLDEPTRGIDVNSKAQIYQLIDDLARGADGKPPRAVILVSSYLPELMGVCDRIAVMHRGNLSEAKPVAECTEHQLLLAATGTSSL